MASDQSGGYPKLTLPAELVRKLDFQHKRLTADNRLKTYRLSYSSDRHDVLIITGAPMEVLKLAADSLKQLVTDESLKNKENPECSLDDGKVKYVFYDEKAEKILSHREELRGMDKSVCVYEYSSSKKVDVFCSYSSYPDLKWKLEHLMIRSPVERHKFNSDLKSPSKKPYIHSLEHDKKGQSFHSVQAQTPGLPCQFQCKTIVVYLSQGSIIEVKGVDAIVNAANEDLSHIGGVAFSISYAAGQKMNDDCIKYVKKSGLLKVSENLVTTAGNLKYKGIIHSVGPKWTGYQQKEKCVIQLHHTIVNIFHTADKYDFSKIAMPAISAGIFGVPEDICANVYVRAIIDYSQQVRPSFITEVHFVDINPRILLAIKTAYENWRKNPDAVYFTSSSGGAGHFSQSMRELQWRHPLSMIYDQLMNAPSEIKGNSLLEVCKDGILIVRAVSHRPEDPSSARVCFIEDTPLPNSSSKQYIFSINGDLRVHIYTGSITKVDKTEAIVCGVGESLKGGKLANALVVEGGEQYIKALEELKKTFKNISPGRVYMCSGGKLRAKKVLHAVMSAPVKDVEEKTIERLKMIYMEIFNSADSNSITSLATPLIGTGRLSVPSHYQCCCVALFDALMEVKSKYPLHSLKTLKLVNVEEQITGELVKVFKQRSKSVPASQQFPKQKSSDIFPHGNQKPRAVIEEVRTDDWLEKPRVHNPKNMSRSLSYNPSRYRDETDKGGVEESDEEDHYPESNKSNARPPENDSKPKGNLNIIFSNDTENKANLGATGGNKEEDDKCTICMNVLKKPETLACGHKFCKSCIEEAFVYRESCPVCGRIFGQVKGNQPKGSMDHKVMVGIHLPGYPECDTIEISYDFPDGKQGESHPHPGWSYRGTRRRAFLPHNTDGKKILAMLYIAFERKLVFTIGESRTTGKTDRVTWNDIHHKTKMEGGPSNYGYPDKDYLKRVKEELEVKGITEADIERQ